ncbi:MAG: MerR family transcriptional regulator [Alphaproteobacteria bacterium]
MRRGDIARATGCTVGMLRHYEAVGLLPEPARTAGGQRIYGDEHRQRLAFVLEARAAGLTVEDIADLLVQAASGTGDCRAVRDRLRHRHDALRAEISRLQAAERRLTALLDRCDGKVHAGDDCPHLAPLLGAGRPQAEPPAPRVAAARQAGVGVPASPSRAAGRVAQR